MKSPSRCITRCSNPLLSLCMILLLCASAKAQIQVKRPAPQQLTVTVPNYDDSYTWPLAIVSVSVGKQQIPIGKQVVLADHSWLDNLIVTVKNISAKTIVEAGVDVSFTETGKGTQDSPFLAAQAHLGIYPDISQVHRDGTSTPRSTLPRQNPLAVPPGGTFSFSFAGYGSILEAAYAAATTVSKMRLQLTTIYFDDSSEWSAGRYFTPTSSANTWRPMTPAEFEQSAKKQ